MTLVYSTRIAVLPATGMGVALLGSVKLALARKLQAVALLLTLQG